MKFIKPTPVAGSVFVSSTAPETDYAEWSGATTYALGDKRISATTHRIYESVQGSNLNHDPTTDDGTWWIDIGPTNRWAMFDDVVGTITSIATPLTVVLDPGIINSLALLDLAGTSVDVSMVDGATTVYSKSFDLADQADVLDWYMYFFEPIQPQETLIVSDLPPYASGRVTVTINAATTAKCGTLVAGSVVDMGTTRRGAGLGIIDYSRKTTDVFGVTSVVERSYAKRIDANVFVENARLNYLAKQLSAIRATPCVWVADDDTKYSSLIAYGFYKDWRINIAYPHHSECALTIEGLI